MKLSRRLTMGSIMLLIFFGCSKKNALINLDESGIPKNVEIAGGANGVGPCEPSISINPSNPLQIVAGSILNRVHVSNDGGKTWSNSKLESSYGVYGDPVVRFDGNGNVYYAHLSNPAGFAYASEEWLDRIVVQKSSDGGKTWNDGTFPAVDHKKDHDKQWLYVDDKSETILMSWTEFDKYGSEKVEDRSRILFSSSSDQGESWTEAIAISEKEGDCIDGDHTTEGALPIMDDEGNMYVAWALGENIYLDKSSDGGKTWLEKDLIAAKHFGGWNLDIPGISRCNGMPILEMDRSNGKYKGTMYINWTDQKNGIDDTDVWLVKSEDGGETWSERIRVNDDGKGNHQFFTWMDVDPITGYIYIVFYDRRNYDDLKTDVFLAYSIDGGNSFSNIKISESPFIPNENVFFGDYNDISAYDGKIRPIWTRLDGNRLSVWTALIEMK